MDLAITDVNQILLVVLYVGGFVSHYLQKCVKEKIGYIEYWVKNPMYSGLSVIGSIGGLTGLLSSGVTDMATYFMAGFMADSLFNKVSRLQPEAIGLPTQPDSKIEEQKNNNM